VWRPEGLTATQQDPGLWAEAENIQSHYMPCSFPSSYPLGWCAFGQDAFVKIVRHEGTRTLWSGLPATL
jgi:hypothetical protein